MHTQNPKLNTSPSSKNLSKKGASLLSRKGAMYVLLATWILFGKVSWHLFASPLEVRIVSLSPALTEVLFELGLNKNIVGTSSYSNFPEAAKKIPTVGSYLNPSIEKILRLKPTHILVFKEGDPSIEESLKKANLNYLVFDSRSLEDYESMVKKIGSTFNVDKKAQSILKMWTTQWEMLASLPKCDRKVIIQVDHNPIFVAGNDTFISKAFEKCGLKNTFSNLNGYKKIQLESVLNRKPDVILVIGQLNEFDSYKDVKDYWQSNPVTKKSAVIKGGADLGRLSSRLPEAILKACNEIRNL